MTASGTSPWTVITVTHDSAAQLVRCWRNVDRKAFEWIVVDNASTDASADVARGLGARVIELDSNLGFGTANNVALNQTRSPWVAFINPDVVVGAPEDFARLATISEANRAVVAPQLLNVDGTEQPNGRGMPYLVDKIAHRSVRLPSARLHEYIRTGLECPTYVAWAIGAAIAGPTELFRRLGGWDERYFLYYEDHDLGLRAWADGTPVVLDPKVRWLHEWQRATTQFRFSPWRREFRSAFTFYRQHPYSLVRRARNLGPQTLLLRKRVWSPAIDVP